jgi:hypothetical protein
MRHTNVTIKMQTTRCVDDNDKGNDFNKLSVTDLHVYVHPEIFRFVWRAS